MSSLQEAFILQVNQENKDFVQYPYVPIHSWSHMKGSETPIENRLMTIGRCFDIKHGTKSCFETKIEK
jgi:hypothetical protein